MATPHNPAIDDLPALAMPTVFLTGATGFLGAHVLHELRAAGHAVRALSRSEAADAQLRAAGADPVRGDLDDEAVLLQGMRGCEAVFHLAADTSTEPLHEARQTQVNVEGTRHMLAAATAAGVSAFLYTSSISAYSHLVRGSVDETTPQRGGESWVNYERTKHAAEQFVRASALPWVIFHPTHVLGPGDRQNWARVIRMIDNEALPGIPPGLAVLADVREIARSQVRAWQAGCFGQSYLLGGEVLELSAVVQRIGARLGKRTPRRASPVWMLRVVAHLKTAWAHARGQESDLTPQALAIACRRQAVSSAKAQAELAYRITPADQLIEDTLCWMRAEGLIGQRGGTAR